MIGKIYSMENKFLNKLNFILIILATTILLVIIATSIFYFLNKSNPNKYRKIDNPAEIQKNIEYSLFSDFGRLRTYTCDNPQIPIVVLPFLSYKTENSFLYEELCQKQRKIKSIILQYFTQKTQEDNNLAWNTSYRYWFRDSDVDIYDAKQFVHASLQENNTRFPEQVDIFITDKNEDENVKYNDKGEKISTNETQTTLSFTVNRGRSILYNAFKIWRNLTLLENSLLLNRLSRSTLIRIMNVEIGDMPKEAVGPKLMEIKRLIEQKTAINQGKSITEYTNPGPMENTIYVPTHNGKGTITTSEVGGAVNQGSLDDIDYFNRQLFGALKVPRQFFGQTDDNAGFSGGESLSLISSRYAKTIIRLQNTMLQALTDAINILLLDKELDKYINKFQLHMVKPNTRDDKERNESKINEIGLVRDIMDLIDSNIEDQGVKTEILKILLSDILNNPEIINMLDEQADKMEGQEDTDTESGIGQVPASRMDVNMDLETPDVNEPGNEEDIGLNTEGGEEETISELPSPADLGVDMTDNNLEV